MHACAAQPPLMHPAACALLTHGDPACVHQFKNEELFRLEEVNPGQSYLVEVCVATTATYGMAWLECSADM